MKTQLGQMQNIGVPTTGWIVGQHQPTTRLAGAIEQWEFDRRMKINGIPKF
jgi:hypothetical protein